MVGRALISLMVSHPVQSAVGNFVSCILRDIYFYPSVFTIKARRTRIVMEMEILSSIWERKVRK